MRAALIGLGMVSRTYGDAFRNSEAVTLGPVFARSRQARDDFAAEFSDTGCYAVEGLDAICADAQVDFVVVATPPNARQDIVEKLVSAQKPILMEKPVERTYPAACALVELCEEAGVPLGIVLQHRARPIVTELHRILPSLGPLRAVDVSIPWWRPQSYYDEPGRGSYERDGGGVLINQAIHTLDLMLSLTGPVSGVIAMTATTAFHEMEAEDFVTAGLTFANGAVGHVFATTASYPGQGETIRLHCANGSAYLAAGQLEVSRLDGSVETIGAAAQSGAGADPMAFTSDWHQTMIEDFADAVTLQRPPLVPGRAALDVHALIAAIEKSAKTGARVAVLGGGT